MTSFGIKEVSGEDLVFLKEKLETCVTKPMAVYGALEVLTNKRHPKKSKMKVYQAEDPMFQSFVLVTPIFFSDNFPSMSVTWDTNKIDDEDVGALFYNIPNWDWDRQFLMHTNSEDQQNRFHDIFKNKCLITPTAADMDCDLERSTVLTVNVEDIQQINLPSKYKLGHLPPSAAKMMHSMWDFNFTESAKEISKRLGSLKGVGVFYQNSNDSSDIPDQALSWAQQYAFGAIGMTHTLLEHRKKGFGNTVTCTLAKQILNEGRTAFIYIAEENTDSLQFHLKIGFKIYGNAGFSTFVPRDSPLNNILRNLHHQKY